MEGLEVIYIFSTGGNLLCFVIKLLSSRHELEGGVSSIRDDQRLSLYQKCLKYNFLWTFETESIILSF